MAKVVPYIISEGSNMIFHSFLLPPRSRGTLDPIGYVLGFQHC